MELLDKVFIQRLVEHHLVEDMFNGLFGLEKENVRVDEEGRLALTPHPSAFGVKKDHPYIKADFSESQVEMITPVVESIDALYHFLESIHDVVTLELKNEYLWPSSSPPVLPENEEEIPIADMGDPIQNEYRHKLAKKYGRKKQMLSGIHYNFSFKDDFLKKLHKIIGQDKSFQQFKNDVYLKVARNVLKYRWLLIYVTGASPVFNKTYIDKCVHKGTSVDGETYHIPNLHSLRNSECGYRNIKPFIVSYDSVEAYVKDLQALIEANELISVKEFYSPVRLKPKGGKRLLPSLLENGIDYLELRMFDLNPFDKIGMSKETMKFIHLFLIYMLLIKDEPFGEKEQRKAFIHQDMITMNGIENAFIQEGSNIISMQNKGLEMIKEMEKIVQELAPNKEEFLPCLELKKSMLIDPKETFSHQLKEQMKEKSFLQYHLDKAKEYAEESARKGYQLAGFEDLELSTQLLLKAAIKRGIEFEILDREENFILLKKGEKIEYVKQATKTSLDSYVTVLIMENKVVSKKILAEHGFRVPSGEAYNQIYDAIKDYEKYEGKPIVIKPKSTNFGLGITIFKEPFSKEDYVKAFEIAFEFDKTVLVEEFLTGKEYRFLVMGDEVVGILHRVPANVVGDGIHTIEELIEEKNKDPLRGKGHRTPLEKIQLGEVEELFLKNQGKTRKYIPAVGEVVYLRENSNISTGGDSIDFTDDIPDSYKDIAIRCAKAAGATFCGVDMMIDDITEEANDTNYGIIEINFNPAIHIHCYPYKGKNRKANEKILDLLFGKDE